MTENYDFFDVNVTQKTYENLENIQKLGLLEDGEINMFID